MKLLISLIVVLIVSGCVPLGDNVVFIKGNIKNINYSDCRLKVRYARSNLLLVNELIPNKFIINITVGFSSNKVDISVNCKSGLGENIEVYSGIVKVGGRISEVDLGDML